LNLQTTEGEHESDMSDSNAAAAGGFAAPPFGPDTALEQIRRALRDFKLSERGSVFLLRGKPVVELQIERGAPALSARVARKLALTPEWDKLRISSTAEQRKFIEEIKKRLARWEQDE